MKKILKFYIFFSSLVLTREHDFDVRTKIVSTNIFYLLYTNLRLVLST